MAHSAIGSNSNTDADSINAPQYDYSRIFNVDFAPTNAPLVMDYWGEALGSTLHSHGEGLNVGTFDGAAAFVQDPGEVLETYGPGPGFPNDAQFNLGRMTNGNTNDCGMDYLMLNLLEWELDEYRNFFDPARLF
jgi:hypothetical protein